MKEKNLTQKDLAGLSGVGQGAISQYIGGLRSPRAGELWKLSKALGVTMDNLWTGEVTATGEHEAISENIALRAKLAMITSALQGTLNVATK